MDDKIRAVLVLEILGKPAKHVEETLSEYVDKIKDEEKVKLINKKLADAKKVEDGEAYTCFAEVEIETNLQKFLTLCFGYMPSHIEIIKPEKVVLKNTDTNSLFNELMRRLHQYDAVVKRLKMENQAIAKKFKEDKEKKDSDNKDKKD